MRAALAAAFAAALVAAAPAHAQDKKEAPKAAAPTKPAAGDGDRTLYGVGLAVANSLEVFSLTPAELETVLRGIRDGVTGKPKFPFDEKVQASVQELARTRMQKSQEKASAKEKTEGPAYLDKASKEKGAAKTASGAIVIPLKEGSGAVPQATDKVKVHYTGTLTSGKVFDSSVQRGQPAEFPLNQVVKCWTEALQKMKVGGKARIVCPPEIAYGAEGRPPVIPGNAVLTFEVELLDIVKDSPHSAPPAK